MSELIVSVVIPTTLRPEHTRAVSSALGQDFNGRLEVILVVDGDRPSPLGDFETQTGPRRNLVVVQTPSIVGAAAARNVGVAAATGEWVAFLDDDDEWMPSHLQALLLSGQTLGHCIVAARARQVVDGKSLPGTIPAQGLELGDSVSNYLFRGRLPSTRRASLFTSCLLAHREIVKAVPWNSGLSRHQDWDWLMTVEAHGYKIVHVDAATVFIYANSIGSISAKPDWESSLRWATSRRHEMEAQTFVDFLAGQPLRYAIQARSLVGVRIVVRELWRERRAPGLGAMSLAAGGLLPRRLAFRIMALSTRARRRA